MRKKKYFYNTTTHRFEKLVVPLHKRLLRILGFLSASTVTALIIVAVAYRFVPSPNEMRSTGELRNLREQYGSLQNDVEQINKRMAELENRDDSVYRAIFGAPPLPDSIRYGKNYTPAAVRKPYAFLSNAELLSRADRDIRALRARLAAQARSYDTLQRLALAREAMLTAIPAIQPISNADLSHIASGFGYRIDPIYKTPKLHTGLDFAAPQGTPIYATADGTVQATGSEETGYGNYVVLRHGYGYGTLYGHMVRQGVRPGEAVRRGQVIGWVGNTGKSTGPHCHYEVIRNGEKTDPVHYFFNDLSPADYQRMVRIAAAGNQSFD